MGTLASVLEDAGLATVALSIIRGQVETTRPPRALHCEFPLGRPLGRPGDPALQRRVIDAAFALGHDDLTGSIEVGKQADFVILADNLFEIDAADIDRTDVLLTVVAGSEVYRSVGFRN